MKYYVVLAVFALAACAGGEKKSTENPPLAAPVVQKPDPKPESTKLSCAKGDETRTLEVIKTLSGCTLNYTKRGKIEAAASSTHGTQHCEKSKDKIRATLEKSGFQCT